MFSSLRFFCGNSCGFWLRRRQLALSQGLTPLQTARIGQNRDACLHGSALCEMARRLGYLLTKSICRQGR